MRWMSLAACAAISVGLLMPAAAAPPSAPSANAEEITFEQSRDWRLTAMERRRSELAVQLSGSDLADRQKTRLQETKSYYDWLAGLPEGDRDHRFRERFDRIDANHDGKIDAAERAAWRDKQRAFYDRGKTPREPSREAEAH